MSGWKWNFLTISLSHPPSAHTASFSVSVNSFEHIVTILLSAVPICIWYENYDWSHLVMMWHLENPNSCIQHVSEFFFFFLSFQILVMIFSWTENVIVTCLSYTVVKRTGHQRHTFSIKKVWTLSAHNMPKYGTCFIKVEVNGIDSPLFQVTHFYYHLHYPW